jgi:hypothetical protein
MTGERSGKAIMNARCALMITYLNRDWFAVEQSFFINTGNSSDNFSGLFSTSLLTSAGSKIRFMIPMVPWLAINFYYAYVLDGRSWYSMDF